MLRVWENTPNYPRKPSYSQAHSSEMSSSDVREYSDKFGIPYRKALLWVGPYDIQERKEFLQSLPEYDVVELAVGGLIGVENDD